MEQRRIGSLDVSVIGLGGNNFGRRLDARTTAGVVHAALDAGINFFDTSDTYGDSEQFLGSALKGRRGSAVIATKFGGKLDGQWSGARPEYVPQAVEASLRRLGVDCIDLYQLHKPDPTVAIEDTLGALDRLVQAGKVREIGCSNFSAEQLHAAARAARPGAARFVSVQNQYNALHREPERNVIPACLHLGIAFIPFSPLAGGLLSGKYRRGQPLPADSRLNDRADYAKHATDRKLAQVESLIAFAAAHGHTLLELAFSWLAGRPALASVIAGATTPKQVNANVAAIGWRLSDAELAQIDALLAAPHSVLSP